MNTVRRVDNQVSVVFEAGRRGDHAGPAGERSSESLRRARCGVAARRAPTLPASAQGHFGADAGGVGHEVLQPRVRAAGPPVAERQGYEKTVKTVTPREVAASYAVGDSGRVCERLVMRMQELPLALANGSPVSGAAIVLGDESSGRGIGRRAAEAERSRHRDCCGRGRGVAGGTRGGLGGASPATALFVCTGYDSFEPTDLAAASWNERAGAPGLCCCRIG